MLSVERPRPHHPSLDGRKPLVRSASGDALSRRLGSAAAQVINFDRLLQAFEKRLLASKRLSFASTLWRRWRHRGASSSGLDKLLFDFFKAHGREDDLLTHTLKREWKEFGGDSLEAFLRRSQASALSERIMDHFFQSSDCRRFARRLFRGAVHQVFSAVQNASNASASELIRNVADICAELLQNFCKSPAKMIPMSLRKVAIAIADSCPDRPAAIAAVSCAVFGMFIGDAMFDVAQSLVDDDYTQEECDVVEGQLYICEMILRSVAALELDSELSGLIDQKSQEYLVSTVIDKHGHDVLRFVERLSDKITYVELGLESESSSSDEDGESSAASSPRSESAPHAPEFVLRVAKLKQLASFCWTNGLIDASLISKTRYESDCLSNPASDCSIGDLGSVESVSASNPRDQQQREISFDELNEYLHIDDACNSTSLEAKLAALRQDGGETELVPSPLAGATSSSRW